MEIRQALTLHGPLRHRNACRMIQRFAVVAPQLPSPQSRWQYHVDEVLDIVRDVQSSCYCGPQRTYLTGFSYGADAVFEVARAASDLWAALWAVDPTGLPSRAPKLPTWVSIGEMSRAKRGEFEERPDSLSQADGEQGDFVCEDRGLDHVDTATAAYGDEKVYEWLLQRKPCLQAGCCRPSTTS